MTPFPSTSPTSRTHSPSVAVTNSSNSNSRNGKTKTSFTDLNENIINEVMTYGNGLHDWLVLMGTCRSLRHTVVHSNIWAEYPVDLCTIPTCFGCGRLRLRADCVWNIICSQTCIQFARLHLSYPDIAECIQALSKKCTIKKLHLRIYHNNHNQATSTSNTVSTMLGAYKSSKSDSSSGTTHDENNNSSKQEDEEDDDGQQMQDNSDIIDLPPPAPLALQAQASQQLVSPPLVLSLSKSSSSNNHNNSNSNTSSASVSSASYSSLSSSARSVSQQHHSKYHSDHHVEAGRGGDNSSHNTTSSSSSVSNDNSSSSGGSEHSSARRHHHKHHRDEEEDYSSNTSPSPTTHRSSSTVRVATEEVARVLGTNWNHEQQQQSHNNGGDGTTSSSSTSVSNSSHQHQRKKPSNSNNIVEEYLYDPELPKLKLESLTIFGWPSSFASNSYSSIANGIFQQIGGNLKSLKLMESSPIDIFEIMARYCPLLETLMVEGFQSSDIVLSSTTLQGKSLKILGLHDTNLKIPEALCLPSLQRFEYVNQDDLIPVHVKDIEQLIQHLPKSVTELDLRVMSIHANECLRQIGESLPNLQRLALQLSHVGDAIPGDIYIGTLTKLAQCKNLTSLEIIGSCMVSIDEEAFLTLQQFRSLRKLKLLYEDDLIDLLPTLLANVEFLEEIIFFENAQDMQSDIDGIQQWAMMEDRLQSVSELFPAIKISLVDCWWT